MPYPRNDKLQNPVLPVDIVLHPSWWHRHEGITFDEDFFFHPARRVEAEKKMEQVLYDRWGRYGLGADHDRDLPQVGPVHLAAGYLTSEMLSCPVEYCENAAPQVIALNTDSLTISHDAPFQSSVFKRYEKLLDGLKTRYGYLCGDIGWGGVLNTALDLRGQEFFFDLVDTPDEAARVAADIAAVIERFTEHIREATGTTSISVNRNVRHIPAPVHLHSECSNVMISTDMYERFFLPIDAEWSRHPPRHLAHPDAGVAPGQVGGRRLPRRLAVPSQATQHGVHQAGTLASRHQLGDLDGGLDGRVRRHAGQPEQLVGADPQQVLQIFGRATPVARHERRQPPIELVARPQDARGDLVRQAAVRVVEPVDRGGERRIERPALADLPQDLQSGTSGWGARGHRQSSMPVVGLDGTAISRRGIRPAR